MKKIKQPELSIIIPVYNESKRIDYVSQIFDYFIKQKPSFEMLVINDGSTDDTLVRLEKLEKSYRFKIITYPINRGKGYAIKTGMLQAQGKHRLFMDVDLSTPLNEWGKFIPFLNRYDVIIGTRKTDHANLLIHQSLIRENLGKGFTFLSQKILGIGVSDFTCGFKCFSQQAAEKIFTKQTINRWGFDSEILFLTKKYKLRIHEIPVMWKNDPRTKVRFPQDIINSFSELLTIRINDFKKIYN